MPTSSGYEIFTRIDSSTSFENRRIKEEMYQILQSLAEIVADLSSKEIKRLKRRFKIRNFHVSRSFKPWTLIYVFIKPTINEYRDLILIMLLPKPVRPVDSEKKGKDN